MRLLGAGAERSLLARRLESVGLEDALESLGGGTVAVGATATTHNGRRRRSGGHVHFVYWVRQTFKMNAWIWIVGDGTSELCAVYPRA